jgi:dephospho-CoA kinase
MDDHKQGKNRLCIAGYMGAGKTTVASCIAAGGIRVIDADSEAKIMMTSDRDLTARIVGAFGASVIEAGALSFTRLGRIAFSSKERLLQLNSIVHPPLLLRLQKLVESSGENGCILDAAVAPLWRIEAWFSSCIWVEADREIRLRRLQRKTPYVDENHILERMNLQEGTIMVPRVPSWKHIINNGSPEKLTETLMQSGFLPQ